MSALLKASVIYERSPLINPLCQSVPDNHLSWFVSFRLGADIWILNIKEEEEKKKCNTFVSPLLWCKDSSSLKSRLMRYYQHTQNHQCASQPSFCRVIFVS